MTVSLEQITDGSAAARNFQKLARLVIDTGGVGIGIRWGSGTLTWPGGGSPFATSLAVSHGLGRAPVVAIAGDAGGGTLGAIPVFSSNALGTTTFSVAAQAVDIAAPAAGITRTFYWIALG